MLGRRLGVLCLAFTASLMLAWGVPPEGQPAWVWLGFAPLAWVARQSGKRGWTARWTLLCGWVGGLCTGLVGFPWIALTLERFADAPAVLAYAGLFAFSAWTAVPYGLWTLGVARGPSRGLKAVAWPCALWVALGAVWPAVFPYTCVIGLAQTPPWIQGAELLGVAGVEVLVVATGVLLAAGALAETPRQRWIAWTVAASIPGGAWVAGQGRLATLDRAGADAPTVTVGLVQPNIPLFFGAPMESLARSRRQSALAQAAGAELVVWPEAGAYPYRVRRPFEHERRAPHPVMALHHVPTILGVPTYAPGERYEYNSAALITPDGTVSSVYDKNILVPFGERIPWVDPDWARSWVPAMSHNNAGTEPGRFVVPGVGRGSLPVGPLICYEDIFADYTRRVAAQPGGVELFVNMTIDTWFGDTEAPWEHLALAQFRAVEHRIPMVRAVAAGPSSYVDDGGRIVATTDVTDPRVGSVPEAEHLVIDVRLPRGTAEEPTIYALGGWLFEDLCIVAVLLVFAVWLGRRYRWFEGRRSG